MSFQSSLIHLVLILILGTISNKTAAQIYSFTTVAGRAGIPGSVDGPGTAAQFNNPEGIAVDSAGHVYVGDRFNHTIRKISPGGAVTTLAGLARNPGSTDGTEEARFDAPRALALDLTGNLYVADYNNNAIRKVALDGVVSTLAGSPGLVGSLNGPGGVARFNAPSGVAMDRAGNVFVADSFNNTIRKITPDGVVSLLAGAPGISGSTDGPASTARFNSPQAVLVDSTGIVYVADYYNNTIRRILPSGVVSTLAGLPGSVGSADGVGTAARFRLPSSLALDSLGNLYVADSGNHTIRKVTPGGAVSTLGGMPGNIGSADGTGGAARFNYPSSVAVDSADDIYVADAGNHTIRKGVRILAPVTPQSLNVILGGNAAFSVNVTRPAPVSYQWQKNGVDVSGATNSTYEIHAVRAGDAGTYSVVVNYGGRSLTTFSAVLTIGFAGRRLPSGFWPGVPFAVELEYIPTPGITNHTVTEQLPVTSITGLVPEYLNADGIPIAYRQGSPSQTVSLTVTNITEKGLFDPVAGTVKWGPFPDSTRRSLRYAIVPPLGWTSPITISGSLFQEGRRELLPQDSVSLLPLHPADNSPATNHVITIFEVAAYATAWRRNLWWPAQASLPELDYVTQAGTIWARGESYQNVGGLLPRNWQPAPLSPGFTKSELPTGTSASATIGSAVRSFSSALTNPAVPIDITVTLTPRTNVTVLFVEEQLPPGWTALNLFPGGSLDTNFNKVKWGPIFLAQSIAANVFAYRAVPPVGAEGVFKLSGLAAFDGTVLGIGGSNQITLGFVASPPTISLQPRSQTVTVGGTVALSVVSAGTAPLIYQWQRNGANLFGQADTVLTVNNIQLSDAGAYRVIISNAAGSITSDLATLQVNPVPVSPIVTVAPQSQTVTAGGSVTFAVTASGTAPLVYQWQKNGTNLPGQTNIALTLSNVQLSDAGAFRVVISNAVGSITSDQAALTVNPAPIGPSITLPPRSQAVTAGSDVTFTITAIGTPPLTYQWQKNGTNLSGQTNTSLTLNNLQLSDAGAYRVVIGNGVGSITSEPATLQVNPASIGPSVTASPQSQTVVVGSSVALSVTATGTVPLSYQWQKDGSNISAAVSTQLVLNNVQSVNAGRYAVVVSNLAGTATSAAATLIIVAPTPIATTADFDGDGLPDLILQDSSGELAAWLMNGTLLASARLLNPRNVGDTNYRIVGSGDFNGDDKDDLLFQHIDGTLAIWSMNGSSLTSASLLNPSHPGDRHWRVAAVVDLNSDRQRDIVFQHSDGTLAIWFMNGMTLSSATLFTPTSPGDSNWTVVGAGDFDGDAKLDLLFQHTDGALAVWLLDGTKLTRTSSLTPSDPGNRNWRVAALADINRDGKPDLVLQHADGTLAVWLMNGVQLGSAQLVSPPNPGGTWRVVAPK